MAADERLRQAELAAERAHLVLEQLAQGLDQLHVHALGQAADVVVRLDGDRGPAGKRHALDHVGIERALRQKLGAAEFFRLGLEHVDEQSADGLALGLRVLDPGEVLEKKLLGFDVHQRDVVAVAKQSDHLAGLAEAQQAVIDEHAGQLIGDGLMDQHGGDRGIHPAR